MIFLASVTHEKYSGDILLLSMRSDDDEEDDDDVDDDVDNNNEKTKGGDPDPHGTKSSANPHHIVANVIKMMSRRRYHESPKNLSIDQCIKLIPTLKKGQNIQTFFLNDEDDDVCMVVFLLKLSKTDFRKILKIMEEKDVNHCIFIVFGSLPRKNFASDILGSQKIEILRARSLFDEDIMDNPLVRPHVLLTHDERKEFVAGLGYDPKRLPIILLNDPMTLYYGGNVGDIFRIDLGNELPPYYRIVQ